MSAPRFTPAAISVQETSCQLLHGNPIAAMYGARTNLIIARKVTPPH